MVIEQGQVPTSSLPVDKTRLAWVDTGKGMAIILVALVHSTNWIQTAGFEVGPWPVINQVASSLRMPLFFTLSGLFAVKWLSADWGSLFRTKVLLFAWVFAAWEVIGSLVMWLGQSMSGQEINFLGTAKSLALSPVIPRFELWFIWALALFFVVARATRRINPRIQLTIAAVSSVAALAVWTDQNGGWIGFAKYYFFFLLGMYFRDVIVKFGTTSNRPLLATLVIAWAAVSVGATLLDVRSVPGVYFINCLLGLLGGIAIARFLTPVTAFRRVGSRTLPIYLAHTPIIIALSFVISIEAVRDHVSAVWPILPMVLAPIAILSALLLYRLLAHTRFRLLYEPPARLARPKGKIARPSV